MKIALIILSSLLCSCGTKVIERRVFNLEKRVMTLEKKIHKSNTMAKNEKTTNFLESSTDLANMEITLNNKMIEHANSHKAKGQDWQKKTSKKQGIPEPKRKQKK